MRHFVVGASQFETKDWLEVLPLEEHFAFEAIAQVYSRGQWSLLNNFVDARSQYQAQVLDNSSIFMSHVDVFSIRTSGCPSGSRKASGTRFDASVRSPTGRPAEYSVNGVPVPLVASEGAIFKILRRICNVRSQYKKYLKIYQKAAIALVAPLCWRSSEVIK